MPKTKISEYSATNSSNTDIEGINIDEGCPPSSINNAIRELMVHLKEFQTGASGDAFTFAGGTLMSGTNTISGAAVISGNINSSGTTNTFSGGNILSGTNTISGSAIISGNINSSGTTNTFSGGNIFSGTNTFSGTNVFSSDVTLNAQKDLRFADSDSSNWVAFQSPATVASNVTWTLPAADGTSNQVLATNGSGTLSWATAGGGASISAGDSKVEVTDTGSNGTIVLNTDNAERMRIDSSGRMLVGTTTARGVAAAGSAVFEIEAVNAIAASLVNNNNSSGSSALLMFGKSRGGAVGGTTVVQNGDELGEIRFAGADGTNLQSYAASIRTEVDGTPGSGDMPGRLIFSTTADGAGSSTERARITSNGDVLSGSTTTWDTGSGSSFYIANNSDKSTLRVSNGDPGSSPYGLIAFHRNKGALIARISTDGSTVAYNTSSDYRLKENVVSMTGALEKVLQLNPVTYIWKETGKNGQGFIAHELAEVCPDAVSGEKDAVDADGNPQYQGVDTSFLVATLTAAIQELNAKVQNLEAQNAAFEARLAALEAN